MSDEPESSQLNQTIIQIIGEKKPQNVTQLIALAEEQLHLPKERILDAVLKLQNQGALELKNQPPPTTPNFTAYLKTNEAHWYWATIAAATITVATVFTVPEEFYPWAFIRYALGIIFVLWLPGYALIKALFPAQQPIKTSTQNLDTVERIALSVATSIAIVPLVGLLLNYTPWGIRLTPIVLSLFALTLVFATAAAIREQQTKKQA